MDDFPSLNVSDLESKLLDFNIRDYEVQNSKHKNNIAGNEKESIDQLSLLNQVCSLKNRKAIDSTKNSPLFYQNVLLSKLACSKILCHATKGGNIEVMGMLLGNVIGNTFVIFDCFELPVEGTETMVNAHMESYEYMVQFYHEMVERSYTRNEENLNIIGWYHSHPGYDCWLSNIDMQTQSLNQQHQDPYLAIVVDPHKSKNDQKVRIGSFRTYQDQNDDTNFYELSTTVFDSELNKLENPLSVKIPFNSIESRNLESNYLQKLSETVKQWRNFKIMEKIENTAHTEDTTTNKSISTPGRIIQTAHEFAFAATSNGNGSRVNIIRSNSVSSIGSSSDIEMEDRNCSAFDSVASSINTIADPSRTSSIHTQMNNQNNQQERNSPKRPHILPAIQSSRYGVIFEGKDRPENKNFNIRTASAQDAFESKCIDDFHESLKNDYLTQKEILLRLKLRQYYRLRMYRDMFSK